MVKWRLGRGRRPRWRGAIVVALGLVGLAPTGAVPAGAAIPADRPALTAVTPPPLQPDPTCTLTWDGSTADWMFVTSVAGKTVTHWLPADVDGNQRLPGGADVACLPAGSYTVTKGPSGAYGIAGLVIGDSGTDPQPELLLTANLGAGTTKNHGTFTLASGASFSVDGPVLENFGTLEVTGPAGMTCGDIYNLGLWHIAGSGDLGIGGCSPRVVTSTGAIQVEAGGNLFFSGTNGGSDIRLIGGSVDIAPTGAVVHSGSVVHLGDGVAIVDQPFRQDRGAMEVYGPASGPVRLTSSIGGGGSPGLAGTIPATMTVEILDGGAATTGPVVNQGSITLGDPDAIDNVIYVTGGNTFTNDGTMLVESGGGTGNRGFTGDTLVTNNGTLTFTSPQSVITTPFTSTGQLTVGTENAGATLGALDTVNTVALTGGTATVDGFFTSRGSSLTLGGGLILDAGPIRQDRGGLHFTGPVTGPVVLSARIGGGGAPGLFGTIPSGTTLTIWDSAAMGDDVVNQGQLTLSPPDTTDDVLYVNGGNTFTNDGTMLVESGGGTGTRGFSGDTLVTNNGTLTFTSPQSVITTPFTSTGQLTVGTENAGATLGAVTSVNNVTLTGGTATVDGFFTSRGSSLALGGGLTIDAGPIRQDRGGLHFTGPVTGPVVLSGRIGGGGPPGLFGTIPSGTTLTIWDSAAMGDDVVNQGQLTLSPPDTTDDVLYVNGGNTFTNDGTMLVESGGGTGTRGFSGDTLVTNNGTLTFTSPQSVAYPPFTVHGTVTVASGAALVTGQTVTASGATASIDGAMSGPGWNQDSGSLAVNGSFSGPIALAGGDLTGSGVVNGSITNTAGTVAPGASPGTLTVNGTYTQGPAGVLHAEVAGGVPGNFDQLAVSGAATLDGTLVVDLTGLPDPPVPIVTAASVNGTFSTVEGIPSSWVVTGTTAVTIAVEAGAGFVPVTPFRALDSRDPGGAWAGMPLGPGESRVLDVGGTNGIPATATAVVANVTVTGGTTASYLQAYPADATRPVTANLLFAPGQTVPNLVVVGLDPNGQLALYNQLGDVHVVVDVVGYFDSTVPGDRFTGITPVRVLDSRDPGGTWAGMPLGPGESRVLDVGGTNGIPATATAVVANVTVTGGTTASYLQAYPADATRPVTANLLFAPGQTVPNLVVVGLDPNGQLALYNQLGDVHVVVDVVGYFDPGGDDLFHPLTPVRVLDDRNAVGVSGPWGPGEARSFTVAGFDVDVPVFATAGVLNITATGATVASFLAAYPEGVGNPGTANLLFGAGQTVPNLAMVRFGSPSGKVTIFNQLGDVDVVADLAGYFAPI